MKKTLAIFVVLAFVAIIVVSFTLYRSGDIVVGSKHFTEQKILGEMIAQLIEANTDLKVHRRLGLQGTKVCFAAVREGDLDIYPEYTGTGLVNILQEPYDPNAGRRDILQHVRQEFRQRWGLVWLKPLGFDNTYVFAMRRQQAEKLGITKVSELEEHKDQLRPGFDHEYTTRPEFARFDKVYGFSFEKGITRLDPDLTYKALQEGSVDVIDAFSTDGRIAAYDFRVLQDDKNLFPPYDACIVVRREALDQYKDLRSILERLAGAISVEQMRQMNYAVTEELRSPANVAAEFLETNNLR
jgi:glycine betaine/choline ABC-type transport system substrate-binding protein